MNFHKIIVNSINFYFKVLTVIIGIKFQLASYNLYNKSFCLMEPDLHQWKLNIDFYKTKILQYWMDHCIFIEKNITWTLKSKIFTILNNFLVNNLTLYIKPHVQNTNTVSSQTCIYMIQLIYVLVLHLRTNLHY